MKTFVEILRVLLDALMHLLALLFQLLERLGRYWVNDMRSRKTTSGKIASFSIGMFAIMCACSLPGAWLNPQSQSISTQAHSDAAPQPVIAVMSGEPLNETQAAHSDTAPQPVIAASYDPSAAIPPVSARDSVATKAILRAEPSAFSPSIAILCPGDSLTYLEQHQAAIFRYYRVQVSAVGQDCDERHVQAGAEGWVNVEEVAAPSDGVASVPTTTPRPDPTPRPRSTERPQPTEHPRPALAPTATPPAPPTGEGTRVANLRREPRIAEETIIGQICPGDTLVYLSAQQVGSEIWYQVRVTDIAQECSPSRVASGTSGWAAASVIAQPSYPIERYATLAGFSLPTAIPATAVPRPAPRQPVAPAIPSGTRTGAVCRDGSTSSATGRGACSHHGGVAYWLTAP